MWTSRAGQILDWLPVGNLEPGSMGDVAIVDRDPLFCDLDKLPCTKVLATILGGKTVYSADSAIDERGE